MKAVICKAYGPPESLVVEEIRSPTPGKGYAVVSVKAAGVNFPDTLIILIRQYLHFNGHSVVTEDAAAPGELPSADRSVTVCTGDNRDVTTREWRIDDRLIVRYVTIAGLGHAWSGGDDAWAFNDARAPDASQLVGEFLHEALP